LLKVYCLKLTEYHFIIRVCIAVIFYHFSKRTNKAKFHFYISVFSN